jgi:divinyl chlorophyllide a 8-vinyl-reductase
MTSDSASETRQPEILEAIPAQDRRRILVAGASGYIGRMLTAELIARGHSVTALCRPPVDASARAAFADLEHELAPAELRLCDLLGEDPLKSAGLRGVTFDAVFSCIASRNGGVRDAWRVERDANLALLEIARALKARHFVLLSAICVQKPRLAFQHAKLAFEQALRESDLTWSIVRPTAYFKSLAGQLERVRRGRPFLVVGDGLLTACKPIGERDLACYLADCLSDPSRHNRILPIGGPGPALTPRDQGLLLFEALGREPRFRHVPPALFDVIIAMLGTASRIFPRLADKAEFARIGRYYASESMLVWDKTRSVYDASATPEYGSETLSEFYKYVVAEGLGRQRLGSHALFDRQSPGD